MSQIGDGPTIFPLPLKLLVSGLIDISDSNDLITRTVSILHRDIYTTPVPGQPYYPAVIGYPAPGETLTVTTVREPHSMPISAAEIELTDAENPDFHAQCSPRCNTKVHLSALQ